MANLIDLSDAEKARHDKLTGALGSPMSDIEARLLRTLAKWLSDGELSCVLWMCGRASERDCGHATRLVDELCGILGPLDFAPGKTVHVTLPGDLVERLVHEHVRRTRRGQ